MKRRPGLSLLETVLVLGILGLLFGLTASAVFKVREYAARTSCQNNLRQIGLAVFGYDAAHGCLPPGAISGPFPVFDVPADVSHGLFAVLRPHLGVTVGTYNWQVSWDSAGNVATAAERHKLLACPRAEPSMDPAFGIADYGPVEVNPFLADIGAIDPAALFEGALPINGMLRTTQIPDGLSQTLLIVEAPAGNPWTSPSTLVSVKTLPGAGRHPGGAVLCMADGSVRMMGNRMDLRLLAKLATRAGGEDTGGWE